MNYDFTIENTKKIINSVVVPVNNNDGLEFMLGKTEIAIKKPYIDEDGDEMGNSIYIDKNDGTVLSIRIVEKDEHEFLFIFFRENAAQKFVVLDKNSPRHIIDFANSTWKEIINTIAEKETDRINAEISIPIYRKQFGRYAIPPELEALAVFQNMYGAETYAECFSIAYIDAENHWLKSWSSDPILLNAFLNVAVANGSGSSYAIWLVEDDLSKCPVIVFGDEGGIHVVAEHLQQLLHLLTYDTEISVSQEDVYFYKDEDDYEESEHRQAYLQWAKDNFKIDEIKSAGQTASIIEAAKLKHQGNLDAFLKKHGVQL